MNLFRHVRVCYYSRLKDTLIPKSSVMSIALGHVMLLMQQPGYFIRTDRVLA